MKTKKQIAKTIKDLRHSLGWSQDTLSRRANIANGTVAPIESGKHMPSLFTLRKIAKVFNVSMFHLTGDDNTELNWDKKQILYSKYGNIEKLTKKQQDMILSLINIFLNK